MHDTNCSVGSIIQAEPCVLVPALASDSVFPCSNAIWWGAYGFWQRLIWQQLSCSSGSSSRQSASTSAVVGVQAAAGILSGCTSALLTNPLDLVKTRLQVGVQECVIWRGRGDGGNAAACRHHAGLLSLFHTCVLQECSRAAVGNGECNQDTGP